MTQIDNETIRAAELALGSSWRVMEEWQFRSRLGWAVGWTPDGAISRAAKTHAVKNFIWC